MNRPAAAKAPSLEESGGGPSRPKGIPTIVMGEEGRTDDPCLANIFGAVTD